MRVALVELDVKTLPGGNVFHTLHGYWKPPDYVQCFWSSGCMIEYISEDDYFCKLKEIQSSHLDCFRQFYRENAF